MIARIVTFLLIFATQAIAYDAPPPALYDVTGVAVNDVLNIRARPDAASQQIGVLAPDATLVEIMGYSDDGDWAMLNSGGLTGYVARRYLVLSDHPAWWEAAAPLYCFGTEPFWNATLLPTGTGAVSDLNGDDLPLQITWTSPSWGRSDWGQPISQMFEVLVNHQDEGIAFVRGEYCSDGMSDHTFALSFQMFLKGIGEQSQFTGCCTMRNGPN